MKCFVWLPDVVLRCVQASAFLWSNSVLLIGDTHLELNPMIGRLWRAPMAVCSAVKNVQLAKHLCSNMTC